MRELTHVERVAQSIKGELPTQKSCPSCARPTDNQQTPAGHRQNVDDLAQLLHHAHLLQTRLTSHYGKEWLCRLNAMDGYYTGDHPILKAAEALWPAIMKLRYMLSEQVTAEKGPEWADFSEDEYSNPSGAYWDLVRRSWALNPEWAKARDERSADIARRYQEAEVLDSRDQPADLDDIPF